MSIPFPSWLKSGPGTMERVRDLRKAAKAAGQGEFVVAVREKSKDRKHTFRYYLAPYAPEPELFS